MTVVGYAGVVWIALAPLLALHARRSLVATTAVTAGTVWLADLLTLAMKFVVGRPRPFERLEDAEPLVGATVGMSFPSGHAATSAAGALVLAVLVGRAVPALAALAVLVAFSRVYVGVHYPLDVLAGVAVGAAVAGGVLLVLRRPRTPLRARRRSEGEPPPG